MKPFSLYIHIPFCFHKCPYCDFNTYAVPTAPEKNYVEALLSELDFRAALQQWSGRPIQTIFFGGGTPSIFEPRSIEQIISKAKKLFAINGELEVTLEANPGTVSHASLQGFKTAGVSRLSLGAQSFQNSTLTTLGRMHTSDHIELAVMNAREAGFDNISLDIIHGVPHQTLDDLDRDLRSLLSLNPDHVSAYALTIERGTQFYVAVRAGRLAVVDEELATQMLLKVESALTGAQFNRYEISNYAKPGKEARHNLAYWNGDDYMGIGAGAHSFIWPLKGTPTRWCNLALPENYMSSVISTGQAEAWREELSPSDAIFEFFFLGLRKLCGVSLSKFKQRFQISVDEIYKREIEILSSEDLLVQNDDLLMLTSRGLLLADSVIENFSSPNLPRWYSLPAETHVSQALQAANNYN